MVVQFRGVLLYSLSGVGKSSIVNAGLIPSIMDEGYQPEVIRLQPRVDEEIIIERIDDGGEVLPSLFSKRNDQPTTVLSLREFETTIRRKTADRKPLLIFDQFEELITLFEENNSELTALREQIVNVIIGLLVDRDLPVKLLFVFREDYLAALTPMLSGYPSLNDNYLRLKPLQTPIIKDLVLLPFQTFPGVFYPEFDSGMANLLYQAFEERSRTGAIEITVFQIVCRAIYEQAAHETPQSFFDREGGITGILETYMESIISSLPEEQTEAAIALLSSLISSAGTRNVVSEENLISLVQNENNFTPQHLQSTLDNLVNRTKLVRRERRRDVAYYDLTSEYLIPWISRKRAEYRAGLEARKLAVVQEAYEEEKQTSSYQRSRAKRFQLLAWLFAALTIFLLSLGLYRAWQELRYQAAISLANNSLDSHPEESLRLALEAYQIKQNEISKSLLHNVVQKTADNPVFTHNVTVRKAIYSPDGNYLAAVDEAGKLILRNGEAGYAVDSIQVEDVKLRGLAFSPDSRRVCISANDSIIRVLSVPELELLTLFKGHSQEVFSVAYSNSGRYIASASRDKTVRIWDPLSGEETFKPLVHPGNVWDAEFSPDDLSLATACVDGYARLWQLEDRPEPVDSLYHPDKLYGLSYHPDGRYLTTACKDGNVYIWSLESGAKDLILQGHSNTVTDVAYSPDGQLLASGSTDRRVILWNVSLANRQKRLLKSTYLHSGWIRSVSFHPNGEMIVSSSADSTLRNWPAYHNEVSLLIGHEAAVYGIDICSDNKTLASAGWDSTVNLWNFKTGDLKQQLKAHHGPVQDVAFNAAGDQLISGGHDGTVLLWDVPNGELIDTLGSHGRMVNCVTFSPSGTAASGGKDGLVKIWKSNIPTLGKALRESSTLQREIGLSVQDIAFNSSGNSLAIGLRTVKDKNKIIIWNLQDSLKNQTVYNGSTVLWGVAISPDDKLLAAAGNDKIIRVWELSSGNPPMLLKGHSSTIGYVAFHPNSKQLASGSLDGTLRLWDISSGKNIIITASPVGSGIEMKGVVFSPDGQFVGGANTDGTIRLFHTVINPVLKMAQQRLRAAQ